MTAARSPSLARYVDRWAPDPVTAEDDLAPTFANRLAATLDIDHLFNAGDQLPLLWHWVYFTEWASASSLGDDGHPRSGAFLPPIPNRRRMFGGGRVAVSMPLVLGTPTVRQSSIAAVTPRLGRSGELLFVTVRHQYIQNGTTAVVEEQDIVYRSDAGAASNHSRCSVPLGESAGEWSIRPVTNAPLLFQFSALTANAHRIHYDAPYATTVEGYPGLVVHGPLLAIYMAEVPRRHLGGETIKHFEFKLTRAVFVEDPIDVQGTREGDDITLGVVGGGNAVHASARAVLA
ncbi:hypothetical protein ACQI4L_04350 [Mycolicibacterium litorale]|uniref:hypothetical protein n=1 Tax=Mycolicibacterium litorale TaxID=758802 RepID=UPI003CF8CFB0